MALAEFHNYPIRMRGAEKDGAWRFNLTFYLLFGNLEIEIVVADGGSDYVYVFGEVLYIRYSWILGVDCLAMSDLMHHYGLWIVVARRRVCVCFVDFLYASR